MPVDDGLAKVMLLRGEFTLNYRVLGRTGWKFRRSAFGAWAIGGAGREVSDADAMAALRQALDAGFNFLDTADGYGNGWSERRIAPLKQERSGEEIGGVAGAA